MSKSRGNVVNPDGVVQAYGADALRVYEMFMGPFDQSIAWDPGSIAGCSRFLNKVWDISMNKISAHASASDDINHKINTTIKKVGDDIEIMSFNTAISALMIFANTCAALEKVPKNIWEKFIKLLAPFAPFITEEIWHQSGHKKSVHIDTWPRYEEKYLHSAISFLVCQINGKKRAIVEVPTGTEKEGALKIALQNKGFATQVQDKEVVKIVFVPDKIINLIIKE